MTPIEIALAFVDAINSKNVVLLGQSKGTIIQNAELKPENFWQVPSAWRVLVRSEKVAEWQLYANQCPLHEIYDRINTV